MFMHTACVAWLDQHTQNVADILVRQQRVRHVTHAAANT